MNTQQSSPQTPTKPKRKFTLTGVLIGVGVALAVLFLGILIVRAGVPTQVYSLNAKAISYSQINLTWTCPATDEQGFHIKRSLSDGGPWEQVGEAGVDATSYQDTGLKGYTAYYYKVLPYNIYGESTSSSYAFTTTLDGPPYNLSAQGVAYDRINLTWSNQANTNSGNYSQIKLYRTGGSGDYNQSADASPGSYSDNTSLLPSTTYTYRLCAFNYYAGKEICADQQVTATTLATPPPPPTPANFTASVYETNKIKLTWDDVAGESKYRLDYGTTPNNLVYLFYPSANTTSYIYTYTLNEGDTRYFSLKACHDVYGCSAPTETVSATIPINPPTNLTATPATDSLKINLAWQDHTTIETNYILERSPNDESNFTVLATLPANTVIFEDTTDLVADTTYYYKVRGKLNDTTFTEYTNTVFVTPTYKYTGINPGWIGKTPTIGDASKVIISQDKQYAYVTDGNIKSLRIVDISVPNQPLILSSLEMAGPSDLELDNNGYLYVIDDHSLKIVNVFDPLKPRVIKTIDFPNYLQDIAINNNHVYLAVYTSGAALVDITNPYLATTIGTININGAITTIAANDNIVLIGNNSNKQVLTTTPANFELAARNGQIPSFGIYDAGNPILDIDIAPNGNAYLCVGSDVGLVALNIQDPSQPQYLGNGRPILYGAINGVKIQNNFAYVNTRSGLSTSNGLQIFNISSPVPQEIKFVQITGQPYYGGIDVKENIAILAESYGGISIVDVATPESSTILSVMPQSMTAKDNVTDGNYLYVIPESGVQDKIYIYDIKQRGTPEKPLHVKSFNISEPLKIALDNNHHALVICENNKLAIIDIRNPASPNLINTMTFGDYKYLQAVATAGNYAYIGGRTLGDINNLLIIDITQAKVVKTLGSQKLIRDIAISGTYAYTVGEDTFKVLSIANPLSASFIGTLTLTGTLVSVDAKDSYAYVGIVNTIQIINVTVPQSPVKGGTGSLPISSSATSITVSGNKLFASCFSYLSAENGFKFFDISTPSILTDLAFLSDGGRRTQALSVDGRYVYLANDAELTMVADLYYDYMKVEQTSSCGGTEGCTSATHNQEITYTLKITNPTPYTFTGNNNILSNPIPANTTYVANSATGGGTFGNGKVTWNLGQVNPNDTREVTFKVKVD